ncbi:hypothetical protein ACTQ49_05435 [Luteococcus sp. Sow4_B9]|uniref:hypothetical protein n=1 Tax=Luteococcus sp. Sow4_B9 TaxID=3438792 RepID=UPI003F9B41BC
MGERTARWRAALLERSRQANQPERQPVEPTPMEWGDGDRDHCQWTDSLCTQTPTHFVTRAVPDGQPAAQPEYYCARHWAVTLARLQEVELARCSCPMPEHLRQAGALVGPRWGR